MQFFPYLIFSFFFAKIADDRRQTCGEHNATTLPHSSNSRQHHVCAHGVSSLCRSELFVSGPAICHPTIPHFSAVLPLRAHVHSSSMSIAHSTLGGNIGNFVIVIYIPTHPYIEFHIGSIFTYTPGVMFCVGNFANTTDDRHQTTRGEHDATCTTLPHSSSRIHHVRARGVSSLCCGELLLSEPVICLPPPYRILLLCRRCVGVL